MIWKTLVFTLLLLTLVIHDRSVSGSEEFMVYGVYKALDLGNPGETPQKDFFINMGSMHGLKNGTTLEVLRRSPTYDVRTEKLQQDVTVPFARLKVIHVERTASIARLEKFLPVEKVPALTPMAVMSGDMVRPLLP